MSTEGETYVSRRSEPTVLAKPRTSRSEFRRLLFPGKRKHSVLFGPRGPAGFGQCTYRRQNPQQTRRSESVGTESDPSPHTADEADAWWNRVRGAANCYSAPPSIFPSGSSRRKKPAVHRESGIDLRVDLRLARCAESNPLVDCFSAWIVGDLARGSEPLCSARAVRRDGLSH